MARTVGTKSLKTLIDHNTLQTGERLILRRRSAEPITATLTSEGEIAVNGCRYANPSAAAKAVLKVRAADGWLRWRIPRLNNVTLAELRNGKPCIAVDAQAKHLCLEDLGGEGFGTVLADPPWRFINRTGKVAPEHRRLSRYDTLDWQEIAALPVSELMLDESHCYLWVPNALIAEGLNVLRAWGFRYKAMIVWAKRRKDGGPDGRGVGFYFRNVTELILFGVRGNLRTLPPARRQVNMIESRKREHSRKPDEQYPIIEACSPGPYLELFARYPRPGWWVWGEEAGADIIPRGKQYPGYRGDGATLERQLEAGNSVK